MEQILKISYTFFSVHLNFFEEKKKAVMFLMERGNLYRLTSMESFLFSFDY